MGQRQRGQILPFGALSVSERPRFIGPGPTGAGTRNRQRGQILPFFAIMFAALALFATLVLDGSFMLESRHDLDVIALHAAQTGASQIDRVAFTAKCGAYITGHPSANVVDCQQLGYLTLNAAAATTAATNSANQWLAELAKQKIGFPGFVPTAGAVVNVVIGPGGSSISVTIRYCYKPFLVSSFAAAVPPCPNAVLVATTVTSAPLTGH